MPMVVIRDSLTAGGEDGVYELEFPSEQMTVRELIRERVYQDQRRFLWLALVFTAQKARQAVEGVAHLNAHSSRQIATTTSGMVIEPTSCARAYAHGYTHIGHPVYLVHSPVV